MSDADIRELEKRAEASGLDEDHERLYRARARAGLLPMSKEPFRCMMGAEAFAARALEGCSLPPASGTKRIARTIAAQVGLRRITDKQAAVLWSMCWSYRRQLPLDVVELARERLDARGEPGVYERARDHVLRRLRAADQPRAARERAERERLRADLVRWGEVNQKIADAMRPGP